MRRMKKMNKFDYGPLVLRAFESLKREIAEAEQITINNHNELVKQEEAKTTPKPIKKETK